MIRWLGRVVLILVLALLVGAGWLLGTTQGARWALGQVRDLVPALSLRVDAGNLLTGLSLSGLKWSTAGLDVTAGRVVLRWRPTCLLDATVCVERLSTEALSVRADPSRMAGGDGGSGGAGQRLSLPVTVQLTRVLARDTHVVVAGRADVRLARLETGASLWNDRLRLAPTRLSGLTVELASGSPATSDAEAAAAEGPLQVALPAVSLPVDVDLRRVTLSDARIVRGGRTWPLDRLELAGRLNGPALRVRTLSVSAPGAHASVRGRVSLQGDWPLSLSLAGTLDHLRDAGRQSVHVTLDGSLARLDWHVDAGGAVQARANGTARVLKPDIPWTLELQSKRLGWPLAGHRTVEATGVTLKGSGDVNRYDLDATARLTGAGVPPGDWHIAGSGDMQGARIRALRGEVLGGSLQASGRVDWAPHVTWDATIQAHALDPSGLVPQLAGKVGGEATVTGGVGDKGWSLTADVKRIDGKLRGYPLALQGKAAHRPDGAWRFSKVTLRTGDNTLRVDGGLGDRWDLDVDLALNRLAALWPGLKGSVSGSVRVAGPTTTPSVDGTLKGDALAWRDVGVERAVLKANVRELLAGDSAVALTATGVRQGDRALGDLDLRFSGRLAQHRLQLQAQNGPVSGRVVLTGGLDRSRQRWNGQLAQGRVGLPDGEWTLASGAALGVALKGPAVTLAPQCWRRGSASLCLTEQGRWQPGSAHAVAALKGFELDELKPWLPDNLALKATVGGRLTLDQEGGGRPTVSAELSSSDGAAVLSSESSGSPVRFAYRRLSLALELDRNLAKVDLSLASEHIGQGSLHVEVNPYRNPRSINGTVGLNGVELALLKPFLPQLQDISGRVGVNGDLGGSLGSPEFSGQVKLDDGRVAVLGVPVPVEAIQLTATISGQSAAVTGQFRMGKGSGRIGGTASWRGEPRATVALAGQGLEFRYPPIVKALTLDPALTFSVTAREISVNGRLSVPRGRIEVKKLPEGAVTVSDDAVIVNREKPAAAQSIGPTLKSNIYLVLGDDVHFKGFGAEGDLTGSLQLRQIGTGGAEANGEIQLKNGGFEKYGQKLKIRTGRLIFAGPISQPRLNIEAVREVGTVVAGLRVTGSAQQPQVTLFSEPPMPQSDILTYLVTGHAPGSATPSEQQLVAQAALSVGVLGGNRLGGALAKQLGVEDFQLEATGQGGDTQVAVSGYLSPNLMVSYGVGVFQPENTLTLRYYMTKNLYLEAVSGLGSALDVFYSFNF